MIVNDRWGKECRSAHGGIYTTEYGEVGFGHTLSENHLWEETRGIGASFGYNRNEELADYLSGRQLVHLLIDTVARGGNLLLNVGPTADGRIPVIMEERLLEIGRWLEVNGEAVYGARLWREHSEGDNVRYTAANGAVYAACLEWPGDALVLETPKATPGTTVALLGQDQPLNWREAGGAIHVELPQRPPAETASPHAYVFKLTGVE